MWIKKINWHDLVYWLLFDVVIDKKRKMKKKFPQTFHFNPKWLQTNPQYDIVIHICRSWCANDTDMNHPYTLAPIISHILTQLNFQRRINNCCYICIYLTIHWSIMPKLTNNVTCEQHSPGLALEVLTFLSVCCISVTVPLLSVAKYFVKFSVDLVLCKKIIINL
jgi:hypothetical protein